MWCYTCAFIALTSDWNPASRRVSASINLSGGMRWFIFLVSGKSILPCWLMSTTPSPNRKIEPLPLLWLQHNQVVVRQFGCSLLSFETQDCYCQRLIFLFLGNYCLHHHAGNKLLSCTICLLSSSTLNHKFFLIQGQFTLSPRCQQRHSSVFPEWASLLSVSGPTVLVLPFSAFSAPRSHQIVGDIPPWDLIRAGTYITEVKYL